MATTNSFSITVGVGSANQEVTLYASDFNTLATKGLRFSLPPNSTIALGTLQEFITWINARLGEAGATSVQLPTQVSTDWPSAIQTTFNGILNAQVTINRFSIEQAPKTGTGNNATYPPMEFTLDVSAKANGPNGAAIPVIPNFLSLVAAGFGVKKTNA